MFSISYNSPKDIEEIGEEIGKESTEDDENDNSISSGWSGWRQCVLPIIVGTTGCFSAISFLGFGVSSLVKEQEYLFEIRAAEIVENFQIAWEDYQESSLWLYEACGGPGKLSRVQFLHIYEYFTHDGILEVQVRSSCSSKSWDKWILSHIYLNFRP
jgi:hypothetical protein